jgi:hypothetical protein
MQVKNFSGNGEGYKQKQNFGTLVPFGIHTLKVAGDLFLFERNRVMYNNVQKLPNNVQNLDAHIF